MSVLRAVVLTIIAGAIAFVIGGGFIGQVPGDYGLGPEAFTTRSFHYAGKEVRWEHFDFKTRAAFLEPLAGSTVTLVTNDGRRITLVAHAEPRRTLPLPLIAVRLAFLLVAGLLALRRWQDPAARALVVFLLAFGLAIGLPNANPIGSSALSYMLFAYGAMVLLDVAAAAGAIFSLRFSKSPTRLERLLARGAIVTVLLGVIGLPFFDNDSFTRTIVAALVFAPFPLALATFIAGYLGAPPEERSRKLWVLSVMGVGLIGPTIDIIVIMFSGYNAVVDQASLLTIVLIPIGLAYVILRHRVIDVGFVLNQAAVYAIISISVAAVFVIVETLLSNYFTSVNHVTSATVQLVVALALGLSISAFQKRVDAVVARLLFRERYAARAALHDFALDAAYITDGNLLLERYVQIVEKNMRAVRAGVWMRDDAGTYALRSGDFTAPATVDSNDPGMVAMRARHVIVDLDKEDTALPGVLAFPMVSGGELVGTLICDEKRNLEDYAPDDRDSIERAAMAVGHAWRVLRVKELEREVADLKAIVASSHSRFPG